MLLIVFKRFDDLGEEAQDVVDIVVLGVSDHLDHRVKDTVLDQAGEPELVLGQVAQDLMSVQHLLKVIVVPSELLDQKVDDVLLGFPHTFLPRRRIPLLLFLLLVIHLVHITSPHRDRVDQHDLHQHLSDRVMLEVLQERNDLLSLPFVEKVLEHGVLVPVQKLVHDLVEVTGEDGELVGTLQEVKELVQNYRVFYIHLRLGLGSGEYFDILVLDSRGSAAFFTDICNVHILVLV
jgi:hypothetical protein